jgi:hypothetical protein
MPLGKRFYWRPTRRNEDDNDEIIGLPDRTSSLSALELNCIVRSMIVLGVDRVCSCRLSLKALPWSSKGAFAS